MTIPADINRVPAALRDRRQWLVWRMESKPGEPKPRKVPYYAGGGRRVGRQGDDSDRGKLVTFDAACVAVGRGVGTGIGFAFLPGDGLIGIDLDNVIDPDTGEIQQRAQDIIRACDSYTEFSPSGRGVHIYSLGETRSHKSNEIGVEMFCGRQFFTVTGRQYPGSRDEVTPIRDQVVERLHRVIDEARGRPQASAQVRDPAMAADRDRVESALASVPADLGYNDWLAVGMALYDSLGASVGLSVWDYWSSKGAKYPGRASIESHWRSFGGGRSPGSDAVIFRLAMSSGWKPPRQRAVPASRSSAQRGAELRAEPTAPAGGGDDADDPKFRRTENGKIQPSLYNTLRVLETDPAWRDVLGFNEFAYRIVKRREVAGRASTETEWADIDDVRLQVYLTKEYGFEPRKATVMDAVMERAYRAPFHPVRMYLESLEWDGRERLPGLLASCWGAADAPAALAIRREDPQAYRRLQRYLELAGRKWLIGAVARIFQPGCKLDTMVVLEGGQGDFKSTSLRALFGDDWFADSKLTIGDKDALAQMQGKWAYEMAEMDAHRKADDTAFKMFLTTQVDRVRWHYGKRAEDVPRQCVFVGTTNMSQYGKDETGMRRVWPVEAGRIDIRRIACERDQLWAEAVAAYRQGAPWWVSKDVEALPAGEAGPATWSEWRLFNEQAESRQTIDAWETPIGEWLADHDARDSFSSAEILGEALKIDRARWGQMEQKRVAAIMRKLGFRAGKVGPKHARLNGWRRIDEALAPADSEESDVPI